MMSKKALDATAAADEALDPTVADAAGDAAKEGGGCPVCGAAFTAADVISILPAEAEREGKRRCNIIYTIISGRTTTMLAALIVTLVLFDGAR